MDCPDDNLLAELAQGTLTGERRAAVERHLDDCEQCRTLIGALARQSVLAASPMQLADTRTHGHGDAIDATLPAAQPDLVASTMIAPGEPMGRYQVLELLGVGGMGLVVSAYDPELDRRVALKLLRGAHDEAHATRLRAEARALARLSHPNVVAVHEIGRWRDRDFVAMEFVDGHTAAEWLTVTPRSWQDVLEIYRAAGAGLAAAHQARLIHRDVKPSNILVGRDGRVRVSDFGLARPAGSPAAGESATAAESGFRDGAKTQTGAVIGTPAYMSPEQCQGRTLDARSDQFSFCVALYEGLFGARPYDAPSFEALVDSIERGQPATGDRGHDVPAWLRRAIRRGLAADPAARYPSMEDLLTALTPARSRWRGRVVVGGAAVLVAAAIAIPELRGAAERGPTCPDATPRLAGLWDAGVRAAAARAFATVPGGADAIARATVVLDDYAIDWVAAHHDACQATHVRHEQSEARLDLRMSCLDRRLAAVGALAHAMTGDVDRELAPRLVEAALRLPVITGCADPDALDRVSAPRNDARSQQVLDQLAEATTMIAAGQGRAAVDVARSAVEAAGDQAATRARALLVLGRAVAGVGQADMAVGDLTTAIELSASAADDVTLAEAATVLLRVTGIDRADLAAAASMEPLTAALVSRSGSAELTRRLALLETDLTWHRGDYRTALAGYQKILAETETRLGPQHVEVMDRLIDLGSTLESLTRHDEAEAAFRRAEAIAERELGPDHPRTAALWSSLGDVMKSRGEIGRAAELYERALAIAEKTQGPSHPDTAAQLQNLADAAFLVGDLELARTRYQRALAVRESALGPTDPRIAATLTNLAYLLKQTGDLPAARRHASRALDIYERHHGDSHPSVAPALLLRAGLEPDQIIARRDLERALAIREAHFGAESDMVDGVRLRLCENAIDDHDLPDAIDQCERAVRGLDLRAINTIGRVRARWSLARALRADGRQRPRALELARSALALLDTAEGDNAIMRGDLVAWIKRTRTGR